MVFVQQAHATKSRISVKLLLNYKSVFVLENGENGAITSSNSGALPVIVSSDILGFADVSKDMVRTI